MNLALVTLVIGIGLNFLSLLISKYILAIESFNTLRFVLNTSANITPLLCLGIDVALPALELKSKFSLAIYISKIYIVVASVVFIFSILLSIVEANADLTMYFEIVAIGLFFAVLVLVNNAQRSIQQINKYFMFTNLWDKIVRASLLVVSSFLARFIPFWVSAYGVGIGVFSYLRMKKVGALGFVEHHSIKEVAPLVRRSLPFLLPTIIAIGSTRYIYYVHYYSSPPEQVALADFCILFGLMHMIPSLNSSKIAEAVGGRSPARYIEAYEKNSSKIAIQELLVSCAVYALALLCILLDVLDKDMLLTIGIGIYAGFIFYSIFPNSPYLIAMERGGKSLVYFAAIMLAIVAAVFWLLSGVLGLAVSLSFAVASFAYIGASYLLLSRVVDEVSSLFRVKSALFNLTFLSLFYLALKYDLFFGAGLRT